MIIPVFFPMSYGGGGYGGGPLPPDWLEALLLAFIIVALGSVALVLGAMWVLFVLAVFLGISIPDAYLGMAVCGGILLLPFVFIGTAVWRYKSQKRKYNESKR